MFCQCSYDISIFVKVYLPWSMDGEIKRKIILLLKKENLYRLDGTEETAFMFAFFVSFYCPNVSAFYEKRHRMSSVFCTFPCSIYSIHP